MSLLWPLMAEYRGHIIKCYGAGIIQTPLKNMHSTSSGPVTMTYQGAECTQSFSTAVQWWYFKTCALSILPRMLTWKDRIQSGTLTHELKETAHIGTTACAALAVHCSTYYTTLHQVCIFLHYPLVSPFVCYFLLDIPNYRHRPISYIACISAI